MGSPRSFLEIDRAGPSARPVNERIQDWREVYQEFPEAPLREQASRCMDCGVPFCNQGCPLGNLIPDWNDLVYLNRWREAIDRLHATNNFPEFTGRLCPAPCEGSCVLGINAKPVTIKQVEVSIIEHAFAEGWIQAQPPTVRTGKRVAVVGSGPAGLAAAAQLNRAGHWVTILERADRIGGLLRYGIPEFKMEKRILDRRLAIMEQEGVRFETGVDVGQSFAADRLLTDYDAVLLAIGASAPRDLAVHGRELSGIHFAMDYLTLQNRRCEGDSVPDNEFISAEGKAVVIIGGGDTGADCLGTAHRQGARSVVQLELMERPPDTRADNNPWPTWPRIFRTSSAHEEGGLREYCASTQSFSGEGGQVRALHCIRVEFHTEGSGRSVPVEKAGTEFELPADLVLLAMGFVGAERNGVVAGLSIGLDARGNIAADARKMTSERGVFVAGDASRGQSLIVWAIREGRQAARHMDEFLMGHSELD